MPIYRALGFNQTVAYSFDAATDQLVRVIRTFDRNEIVSKTTDSVAVSDLSLSELLGIIADVSPSTRSAIDTSCGDDVVATFRTMLAN
jgi:hypothetical protein